MKSLLNFNQAYVSKQFGVARERQKERAMISLSQRFLKVQESLV